MHPYVLEFECNMFYAIEGELCRFVAMSFPCCCNHHRYRMNEFVRVETLNKLKMFYQYQCKLLFLKEEKLVRSYN